MTYKHVKFEDSPTMRALEKVAREKGLVKPEALQKKASLSKRADYSPSSNLMENIIKLCSGLRAQGLEKEASELEINYFNYKQAQTLYETSKETGEDLVQSAHPKGSHKLEDIDSDEATVEDILDQHTKILNVVEKKPSGKLASSQEIIDAVKISLGGVAEFTSGQLGASSWSRLLGLLGRTAPAIELAAPGAGAAGGGTAAGVAGASIGAMGALAGAVLAGAVGGAIIGNALFEHYLAPDDLKDAGERFIKKTRELENELPRAAGNAVQNFEITFDKIMDNYSVIESLQKHKDPKDLPRLKQLSDQLWESNKTAQAIWGWAQAAADESWKPKYFSGPSDIVALAKNYMDRTNKLTSLIDKFIKDAAQIADQKMKEQVSAGGGDQAQSLVNNFGQLLKTTNLYQARLKVSKLTNVAALSNWLNEVAADINNNLQEFQKNEYKFDPQIISHYQEEYDDTKMKLDAFKRKYNI